MPESKHPNEASTIQIAHAHFCEIPLRGIDTASIVGMVRLGHTPSFTMTAFNLRGHTSPATHLKRLKH
jgi:hypothetical protein